MPLNKYNTRPDEGLGHGSLYELMNDCAALLTGLEDMDGKLDKQALPLSAHVRLQLQEMLERAGAARIEDEAAFDVTRHQSIPVARIFPGTPIVETIEPGYRFGNRVLKRAKVRVVR